MVNGSFDPNLAKRWQAVFDSTNRKNAIPVAGQPYGEASAGLGDWDYQTANAGNELGPRGQNLPFRAIAWDAHGRPYYGEGWNGWVAETRGRAEDLWFGKNNDTTPVDIKRGIIKVTDDMSLGKQIGTDLKNTWAYLQNGWDWAINNTKRDGTISPLGQLSRVVGGSVDTIIDGVDRAAKAGTEIISPLLLTVGEVGEKSGLPELGLVQALGDLTGFDKNSWFRVLENIDPTHVAWDSLRSITASLTFRVTPDEAFNILTDSFTGRKVAMSAMIDETLMEDYLARVRAGENPALLASEMEDPIAEMIGEIAFDPFNYISRIKAIKKLSKSYANFEDAKKAMAASEDVVDALVAMDRLGDAGKATRINDLRDVIMRQVSEIKGLVSEEAGKYGLRHYTAAGKQALAADRINPILGAIVLMAKGDADEAKHYIDALILMASGNADEVKEGISFLRHLEDPGILMSPAASELGIVLRELTEGGGVPKWWNEFSELAGDMPKQVNFMNKKLGSALSKAYPELETVMKKVDKAREAGKIVKSPVSRSAEFAFRVHQKIQSNAVWKGLNTAMHNILLRFNPGYYVRNYMSDTMTTLADQGLGPAFTHHNIAKKNINKVFGYVPPGAQKAFSKAGELAGKAKGLDKVEVVSSLKVYWGQLQKDLPKLVNAAFDDVARNLTSRGVPEDEINFIRKLMVDSYGDVDEVAKILDDGFKAGFIAEARSLGMLSPEDARFLRSPLDNGYPIYDELLDISRRGLDEGKSADDIIAEIDEVFDRVLGQAEDASKLPSHIPEGHPAFEDIVTLESQNVSQDVVNYTRNTTAQYYDTIDEYTHAVDELEKHLIKQIDALPEEARVVAEQELKRLKAKYMPITAEEAVGNVKRANKGLRNKALAYSDPTPEELAKMYKKGRKTPSYKKDIWPSRNRRIKRLGGGDKAEGIKQLWNLMGIEGEFIEGLTVKEFYNMYWDDWHPYAMEQNWRRGVAIAERGGEAFLEEAKLLSDNLSKQFGGAGLDMSSNTYQKARDAYSKAAKFQGGILLSDGTWVVVAGKNSQRISTYIRWAQKYAEEVPEFLTKTPEELVDNILKVVQDVNPSIARLEDAAEADVIKALEKLVEDRGLTKHPILGGLTAEAVTERVGELKFERAYPHVTNSGMPIQPSQAIQLQLEEAGIVFDRIKQNYRDSWGNIKKMTVNPQEAAVADALTQMGNKRPEMLAVADQAATGARNWALHDYRARKGIDLLMAYPLPYWFWPSRTYTKWMRRLASNPKILSRYAIFRDFNEKLNADAPEWYRQNVKLNGLLGIDFKNPIYLNLEAAINPMHGLTESPFNSPEKRVNGWTAALDDLGKTGFSVHPIWNMATAMIMMAQGEDEAATYWGGTGISPQAKSIKSITSLAGIGPPGGLQLDPTVHIFSGGIDPYERRRVGKALAAIAAKEPDKIEEIYDAAHTQEGEMWDRALTLAVNERGWGQLGSFLAGTGFKPRTQNDIAIEEYDRKRSTIFAMREDYTPEEWRTAWQELRAEFPFGDLVTLSRKGGIERDIVFASSVLSRVPPALSDDYAKAAGIPMELMQEFWGGEEIDGKWVSSKWEMDTWEQVDIDKFMAGITSLAAILEIPSDATRQEWEYVKDKRKAVNDKLELLFGEDIHEMIDGYYEALAASTEARDLAEEYIQENPGVEAALQLQKALLLQDSLTAEYYGGLRLIDQYYRQKMYSTAEELFGADIRDVQDGYFELFSKPERRAYLRQYPQLPKYWDFLREQKRDINVKVAEFGALLPEGRGNEFRPEEDITSLSGQALMEELMGIEPEKEFTLADWSGILGPIVLDSILTYSTQRQELPSTVFKNVEFIANQNDWSVDEVIQFVMTAYLKEQGILQLP